MSTTILNLSIVTEPPIYIPTFNPDNGIYIDECPILPRQRSQLKCMCNHKGTLICTASEFKAHIKIKKHKDYITNYLENIKEIDNAIAQNKKLQSDYELMYRKLTNENTILKKKIVDLEKNTFYDLE
jgi:hypothetical protein